MSSSEIKDWVLVRGVDSLDNFWVLSHVEEDGTCVFITGIKHAKFFKSSAEAWQFNFSYKCDCVAVRWLDCLREEVEK